jgi:hypothetical protein
MGTRDKGKRDYTAIGIFSVVLTILVAAGVYFTLNLERGVLNKPLETVSKAVEEISQYGKKKSMCAKVTTIIRKTGLKKPGTN